MNLFKFYYLNNLNIYGYFENKNKLSNLMSDGSTL